MPRLSEGFAPPTIAALGASGLRKCYRVELGMP